MRDTILASLVGALMVLSLFGSYQAAHGAKLEREYTRRSELARAPVEDRRARTEFLRVNGFTGVPDECELYVVNGGDPSSSRDYRMPCWVIRIMGTEQ